MILPVCQEIEEMGQVNAHQHRRTNVGVLIPVRYASRRDVGPREQRAAVQEYGRTGPFIVRPTKNTSTYRSPTEPQNTTTMELAMRTNI